MTVVTDAELDAQARSLEADYPEFRGVYETPTCCRGCSIPYDKWSFETVAAYGRYEAARWLRGDDRTYI